MKNRKALLLILLVIASFVLGGCGGKGPVASKGEAEKYVKDLCDEDFELTNKETISEDPHKVVYTFKSKQRDLEFEVTASREPLGGFHFMEEFITVPEMRDNYKQKVYEYYEDRIESVLDTMENERGELFVSSTEDIKTIAEALYQANVIYQEERNYNSQEFMMANPYRGARIYGFRKDGSTFYFSVVDINGSYENAGKISEIIRKDLAQKITDDTMSAETYTGLDEEISSTHVSKLEHIYLNDEELLYDSKEGQYTYYGPDTDRYLYSDYDYDKESYMMQIDCGMEASGGTAYIVQEYVERLGGNYQIVTTDQEGNVKDLETKWDLNGHTYTMKAHYDNNAEIRLSKIKFYKDGKDMGIEASQCNKATFIAVITADDFCKLFDLTYKVDESTRSISFCSK